MGLSNFFAKLFCQNLNLSWPDRVKAQGLSRLGVRKMNISISYQVFVIGLVPEIISNFLFKHMSEA